jgi:hypothetical protein
MVGQAAQGGANRGCLLGCLGLIAAGVVVVIASTSVWVGGAMVVAMCGATGAIASGRFPAVPRSRAVVTVAIALLSALGVASAVARNRERAEFDRRVAESMATEAARTADRDAHLADVRAHASETMVAVRSSLDAARAALDAGRFADAVRDSDAAAATLADVLALDPPVEGASALAADGVALREVGTACASMQSAIDRAHAATTPADGADLIAWDDDMESISDALGGGLPVAQERLHDQIEGASRSLSRLRSQYRRQVAQARRQAAAAVANVEQRLREQFAATMDEGFIHDGVEVESVRATGDGGTTLRIQYALCGRVFLDRVAGSADDQAAARSLGFRRIECRSYFQHTYIDL